MSRRQASLLPPRFVALVMKLHSALWVVGVRRIDRISARTQGNSLHLSVSVKRREKRKDSWAARRKAEPLFPSVRWRVGKSSGGGSPRPTRMAHKQQRLSSSSCQRRSTRSSKPRRQRKNRPRRSKRRSEDQGTALTRPSSKTMAARISLGTPCLKMTTTTRIVAVVSRLRSSVGRSRRKVVARHRRRLKAVLLLIASQKAPRQASCWERQRLAERARRSESAKRKKMTFTRQNSSKRATATEEKEDPQEIECLMLSLPTAWRVSGQVSSVGPIAVHFNGLSAVETFRDTMKSLVSPLASWRLVIESPNTLTRPQMRWWRISTS
mmetsp:Transcript_14875/g.42913  ORF Transcript_14875/g.42913 Transcript_14875/m.42913 type:complete len:324 (-) Transcript_14875:1951-2922(-)